MVLPVPAAVAAASAGDWWSGALGVDTLVFALLTGVTVVGVTMLADHLGGRAGGLLATAPVTTSAAHVVIATSVPPAAAALRVLDGGAALLASTAGIVVFFFAVKFSRGNPDRLRLAVGLVAYFATFLPLTVALARTGLGPVVNFTLLFAWHFVLALTFIRVPVPVLEDYVPKRHARSPRELTARFVAGFGVVVLIRALVNAAPALAGALAVVPAVFVVSLTVMGVQQNAPFAARASQAGLFGTTAVAVFVLVVAGVLALVGTAWAIWLALPFAWAAYAGTLVALGRVHKRLAA